jgi:hypothetical protein
MQPLGSRGHTRACKNLLKFGPRPLSFEISQPTLELSLVPEVLEGPRWCFRLTRPVNKRYIWRKKYLSLCSPTGCGYFVRDDAVSYLFGSPVSTVSVAYAHTHGPFRHTDILFTSLEYEKLKRKINKEKIQIFNNILVNIVKFIGSYKK